MKPIAAFSLIAAWCVFAAIAPRVLGEPAVTIAALIGMAATIAVLALSGHVSKPDPLRLNLTGRRPYWETR